MRRNAELSKMAAIMALLIGSAHVTASTPDDEISPSEAKEVVADLINAASDVYDCSITFDSLYSDFDLEWAQYSVFVKLNGKECGAAMREIQSRGVAFRLKIGEIQSIEIETNSEPRRNLDLIHEIDPQTDN